MLRVCVPYAPCASNVMLHAPMHALIHQNPVTAHNYDYITITLSLHYYLKGHCQLLVIVLPVTDINPCKTTSWRLNPAMGTYARKKAGNKTVYSLFPALSFFALIFRRLYNAHSVR